MQKKQIKLIDNERRRQQEQLISVDQAVGKLVQALQSKGILDDTYIIFTSDHGEELGDHWLLGKGGYFDASYSVPCIIRDPRAEATRGKHIDAFTEHVDVMPTLLDAIGAPMPRQCDGHSLSPFLSNGIAHGWWNEAHWEFDFRDASDATAERSLNLSLEECNLSVIRSARYKYVHFANLPPLFCDLQTDPHEFHNLAADRVHAPLVLEYAQKLISWRQRHEDRTLTHLMATPDGLVER